MSIIQRPKITIVSAIFDCAEQDIVYRQMSFLQDLGVPTVLYANLEMYAIIRPLCTNTILLMPEIKIEKLWIHGIYEEWKSRLSPPQVRNEKKDTELYILHRHAKHEILEHAAKLNAWRTPYFVWVDFNTMHLYKDIGRLRTHFHWMNTCRWKPRVLSFVCGYEPLNDSNHEMVADGPYWRFCGNLFGDAKSIIQFCHKYKEMLPIFLETYKKWVWEFNVWAWIEKTIQDEWTADTHPETIDMHDNFRFGPEYYTQPFEHILKKSFMPYTIPNFYASSSCYLYWRGTHYINTRYVNYWMTEYGPYMFQDQSVIIKNKNVLSKWNMETMSPEESVEIEEKIEMNYDLLPQPISVGLEDIRLFEYEGKIKYIATTIGYSKFNKARIIMGDYDIETHTIVSGTIIVPPMDTYCEKNWTPIVRKIPSDSNSAEEKEELLFVYRWSPMEIGKIVAKDGLPTLEIIESYPCEAVALHDMRGSSPFFETDRGLLCVIHCCKNCIPRHYYHMLVLLDKKSLHVIEYSNMFCFEKIGVEFCIGFTVLPNGNYVFWISRHDRDPCVIEALPHAFTFTAIPCNLSM